MDFDAAYIVSDLHLGGKSGKQMFSAGETFRKFCRTIASDVSKTGRTLLLINGDFVDFLAEEKASYWNGDKAAGQLKSMSKRAGLKQVFEGLQSFVSKTDAHLVVVLGNHDLELALPDVRKEFIKIVSQDREVRKSRIEFAFDGWGYRFHVGRATALATHGNEVDSFNFTRFDILSQIIQEQAIFGESQVAKTWKPSAGTAFVIDAINPIKQQFPFVDLLKPEKVTFLALTLLAPKNLAAADEFAELLASSKYNEFVRPTSERRFLSAGDVVPEFATQSHCSTTVLEALAHRYVRNPNLDIEDLILTDEDELLGVSDWVESARRTMSNLFDDGIEMVNRAGKWVLNQTTIAAKKTHALAMRNAVRPFLATESFHVASPGKHDRKILKMVRGSYDVVFTGHTHVRRFCDIADRDTHLVNTGTWAGLMRLTNSDVASSSRFQEFYELLLSGTRADIQRSRWFRNECPVGVMRKQSRTRTELKLARVDQSTGKILDRDHLGNEYEISINK